MRAQSPSFSFSHYFRCRSGINNARSAAPRAVARRSYTHDKRPVDVGAHATGALPRAIGLEMLAFNASRVLTYDAEADAGRRRRLPSADSYDGNGFSFTIYGRQDSMPPVEPCGAARPAAAAPRARYQLAGRHYRKHFGISPMKLHRRNAAAALTITPKASPKYYHLPRASHRLARYFSRQPRRHYTARR